MKNLLIALASIGIVAIGAYAAAPAGSGGGVRPPEEGGVASHASTHENGGADEVDVGGLSGVLADDQSADELRTATTQVNIGASAAPGVGDVLTATAADAATWQAPAGGGCGGATSCDMNDDVATNYGAASDMACTWNTGITPDSWTCVAAADNAAIGIGYNIGATELTTDCVAIGNGVNCDGASSVVIGDGASATATTAISIGNEVAAAQGCVMLGYNSTGGCVGTNGVAIGNSADIVSGAANAVCIGNACFVDNAAADGGVAIGNQSEISGISTIAIGDNAEVGPGDNYSVALGKDSLVALDNVIHLGSTSYPMTIVTWGHRMSQQPKTLTDEVTTAFARVEGQSNEHMAGSVEWAIHANDASDYQVRKGETFWAMVNKAGAETVSCTTLPTEVVAVSAGTLTATITCDFVGNDIQFNVNANTSLTPTALSINYHIITDTHAGASNYIVDL